jgi:hypothetical protein
LAALFLLATGLRLGFLAGAFALALADFFFRVGTLT